MIEYPIVSEAVEKALEGTDIYVVTIDIDRDNNISVELDSDEPLDLDTCARVTEAVNAVLDRDAEDYSLEVGSAGITSPLKIGRQYVKNIGHTVEVLTRDGRKLKGIITDVTPEPLAFTLSTEVKVKEPGSKRPVMKTVPETFNVAGDIRTVTPTIDFK